MNKRNKSAIQKKTHILVVGNEKGGAGKTTCSMHLITSLLDQGYNIASIDTDSRQASLTNYINNRKAYNKNNPSFKVPVPLHFHLQESSLDSKIKKEEEEVKHFQHAFVQAQNHADYIIIDTPGSYTNLSRLAHSYADTVITPINDSFIDLDVLAKINNNEKLEASTPSIYSQMLWEQKLIKAKRGQGNIDWVVLRNRLSSLDARNKRNVNKALEKLSKRIAFRIANGFSERVIFRELFLQGLTLIDLNKKGYSGKFNLSHVAARQELRDLLSVLGIPRTIVK
ncbi:MAG: AAA family ATPase [Rickettsiaceae bacterium]|nr:AAA family ATPase [Rickettsiaceae bacterium]